MFLVGPARADTKDVVAKQLAALVAGDARAFADTFAGQGAVFPTARAEAVDASEIEAAAGRWFQTARTFKFTGRRDPRDRDAHRRTDHRPCRARREAPRAFRARSHPAPRRPRLGHETRRSSSTAPRPSSPLPRTLRAGS